MPSSVWGPMRRYFEFSFDGNPFGDQVTYYDTTKLFEHQTNLVWAIMPYKPDLYDALTAISGQGFDRPRQMWIILQDQGVDPAPDCPATHLPRAFSFMNIPLITDFYAMLFSGFPVIRGTAWTGDYSKPLLSFSTYPPWLAGIPA